MRDVELSPVWHTAGTSGGGPGDKTGHTTVTGEQGARRGQGCRFPLTPRGRRLIPRLEIFIKIAIPGADPSQRAKWLRGGRE